MLYPKKINAKKGKKMIQIGIAISIVIALILWGTQKAFTPQSHWAWITIACMIYAWIITLYSIKTCQNIAGHVFLQMLAVSALLVYIDYITGFEKWSLNIAIPIVIMTANIIMLILTIVARNRYIQYVIYQIFICIVSYLPVVFITEHLVKDEILSYLALGVSIINFIVFVILCHKSLIEGVKRKLHM